MSRSEQFVVFRVTTVSNLNPITGVGGQIDPYFWHECAAFQRSPFQRLAFGQLTACNDVVPTIFPFFPFFGASVRRSSGRRSGGRLLAMT